MRLTDFEPKTNESLSKAARERPKAFIKKLRNMKIADIEKHTETRSGARLVCGSYNIETVGARFYTGKIELKEGAGRPLFYLEHLFGDTKFAEKELRKEFLYAYGTSAYAAQFGYIGRSAVVIGIDKLDRILRILERKAQLAEFVYVKAFYQSAVYDVRQEVSKRAGETAHEFIERRAEVKDDERADRFAQFIKEIEEEDKELAGL